MNAINRRGMKVVCVQEIELSTPRGYVYPGPYPVLDQVYTVMDFIDNTGALSTEADEEYQDGAAIELLEIPCPEGGSGMKLARRIGWPIVMFRPAYEGKTDISVFAPAPVRTLEPV